MKRVLDEMDVVLLAGGLGSRVRNVLGDTPKILAPVRGRTFLDYLLERLAALGAGRVVLSLGHMAERVVEHLRQPSPLPVVTVIETTPLGTGGGLRLAFTRTRTDTVLVMNGDTWLEADYAAFLRSHRRQDAACSILCVPVDDVGRYGSVTVDPATQRILGFVEKGKRQGPGVISGGVYLFEQAGIAALAACPGPSLERDFFQTCPPGGLHAFTTQPHAFLDIGTPETLALAEGVVARDGKTCL